MNGAAGAPPPAALLSAAASTGAEEMRWRASVCAPPAARRQRSVAAAMQTARPPCCLRAYRARIARARLHGVAHGVVAGERDGLRRGAALLQKGAQRRGRHRLAHLLVERRVRVVRHRGYRRRVRHGSRRQRFAEGAECASAVPIAIRRGAPRVSASQLARGQFGARACARARSAVIHHPPLPPRVSSSSSSRLTPFAPRAPPWRGRPPHAAPR